jgi:hypothetical protein
LLPVPMRPSGTKDGDSAAQPRKVPDEHYATWQPVDPVGVPRSDYDWPDRGDGHYGDQWAEEPMMDWITLTEDQGCIPDAERQRFIEQIEYASRVVAKWPAWKRNILRTSETPTMTKPRPPVVN